MLDHLHGADFIVMAVSLIAPTLGIVALSKGIMTSVATVANVALLVIAILFIVPDVYPFHHEEEFIIMAVSLIAPMLSITALVHSSGSSFRNYWICLWVKIRTMKDLNTVLEVKHPNSMSKPLNDGEVSTDSMGMEQPCNSKKQRRIYLTWGAGLASAFVLLRLFAGDVDFWQAYVPLWVVFAAWFIPLLVSYFRQNEKELNAQSDKRAPPVKKWPACLVIANILAMFSVCVSWDLCHARGESAMAVVILWPMIVLPAQIISWIVLIVARCRREKPWWAYVTALLPVFFVIVMMAFSFFGNGM